LRNYAAQGLRVIAMATKPLDSKIPWHQIQRISRSGVDFRIEFETLWFVCNPVVEDFGV